MNGVSEICISVVSETGERSHGFSTFCDCNYKFSLGLVCVIKQL